MKTCRTIVLILCVLSFFVWSWFARYQPVSLDLQAPVSIQCEIKGEIQNPGVYTIANGSTVQMLVEEAGGALDQADLSALSLMEVLSNNQVVVIPQKTEQPKISINTASEDQLCSLPGIGPALAGRIVEYRSATPFSSLEQIMEVKGIGAKMFAKIKEQICL